MDSSKMLKIVGVVFNIISTMHFVAGLVLMFVFLPVGLALAAAGFIFFFIALIFYNASKKQAKKEELKKNSEG